MIEYSDVPSRMSSLYRKFKETGVGQADSAKRLIIEPQALPRLASFHRYQPLRRSLVALGQQRRQLCHRQLNSQFP